MNQRTLLCCCLLFCTHLTWAQLSNLSTKTATSTIGNYSNISLGITALALQDVNEWTTQSAYNNLGITTEVDTERFYSKSVSIGIGTGRLATNSDFKATGPAISLAFDRHSEDMFGVDWFTTGFYIGHASYDYSFFGDFNNSVEASEVILAARYGLSISKMMRDLKEWNLPVEVYASLQLGYAFLSIGDLITIPPDLTGSDGLYSGISIGATYYFKQFGAFAEIGRTEAGLLKVGASYRF